MSDGSGACAWTYDTAGHILTERRTIAGITKTISYSYNLDGSIATVTYPSGRQVAYAVSNAQRLTAAKDVGTGTQYAGFASYAAIGALQSVITGQISGGFAGVTESHTYNNRLEYTGTQASSSNGTPLNLTLAYNISGGNNGSVASITNNVDNGRTETFQYDPLNRITSATSQATSGTDCWGQSFTPDALANLATIGVTQCSGNTLSLTVNANNQFTSLSYDAAGNTTNDGSFAYTYDAENRITSAAGVNYTYDGYGLRVKKSNGTLYWRSLSGEAIAETDLSGNTVGEYIFFAGRRVARLDSSARVFYYFADPLGNTRTITDSTGHACYDADFTPYGQEIVHTNTCPQNYKFTGFERDAETGNDYAFARYYSPRLARFLSPDPLGGTLGDPQTLNRYAYTRNDPINNTDPSGMVNVPGYRGGGGGGINLGYLLNISLGLVGANGGFGSGWNEFDLLIFAFTPTGTRDDAGCPNGDCADPNIYGNIGALAFLFGGDPGATGGGAPQANKKDCFGEARVIGAGKQGNGAFGPTTTGSLAIIPTQFTGGNGTSHSAYINSEKTLRPLLGQISVAIANPNTGAPLAAFGPITDVIAPRSDAAKLMELSPGDLILEVNGVPETSPPYLPVVVTVPGALNCPTGTREIK